ncbi:uncharacterized protein LOC144582120 [Callithrix jacchus]
MSALLGATLLSAGRRGPRGGRRAATARALQGASSTRGSGVAPAGALDSGNPEGGELPTTPGPPRYARAGPGWAGWRRARPDVGTSSPGPRAAPRRLLAPVVTSPPRPSQASGSEVGARPSPSPGRLSPLH